MLSLYCWECWQSVHSGSRREREEGGKMKRAGKVGGGVKSRVWGGGVRSRVWGGGVRSRCGEAE